MLYIGMGETDEFGHGGRYDHYLHSAHAVDENLRTLWNTVQSLPEYRNKTTMIVTTDHGRGNAPDEWKSHGEKIGGSDRIWIAIIGPDTPALGNVSTSPRRPKARSPRHSLVFWASTTATSRPRPLPPSRAHYREGR